MVVRPKCHVLLRTVVIFPICNFNSSYTPVFPLHLVPAWLLISVSVYDSFVFLPLSTSVNKHISGTGVFRLYVHLALMHSLINTGSMNVGLMQIFTPLSPSLEMFCPVMTKIKYMYTTTHACTQCPKLIVNVSVIIEPFWSFCFINILKTGIWARQSLYEQNPQLI